MYQTQIVSVNGSQITDVYGKSLINIGNSNFTAGDYAWTDGKCVFGNEQAAGSIAVLSNNASDIPILQMDYTDSNTAYISFINDDLTVKDKIAIGAIANNTDKIYLVNNEDHAYLINSAGVTDVMTGKAINTDVNTSNFVDGCVDDEGNVILLTNGHQDIVSTIHYNAHHTFYYTSVLGPLTNSYVYKNGEKIDEIDLSSYLKSMHTGADMSGQMNAGGRVNKDGSYRLTVQSDVEHYNPNIGETTEHNNDDINGVGKWTDSSTLSKIRLDLGNNLSQIESTIYSNNAVIADVGAGYIYSGKGYPPPCAVQFSDGILYNGFSDSYYFIRYIAKNTDTYLFSDGNRLTSWCGNARLCKFTDIAQLKKALNAVNL